MKKTFFRSKFKQLMFIILLPLMLFAVLTTTISYVRVGEQARNHSVLATDIISYVMSSVYNDLIYYRISIEHNPQLNVEILNGLLNPNLSQSEITQLHNSLRFLSTSRNVRAYWNSIYIALRDSDYVIVNGLRVPLEDFPDYGWQEEIRNNTQRKWIRVRTLRNHHLQERGTEVVTIFQQMNYGMYLVININQQYLNRWLDTMSEYDGQSNVILDYENQIIFSNTNFDILPENVITEITDNIQYGSLNIFGYHINTAMSSQFQLRYLSLIPQREILRLPTQIALLSFGFIFLSIVFAVFLSVNAARKDAAQVLQIVDVFEQAEKGNVVHQNNAGDDTPYFFIINNIINLFLSQSYLRVQSEARKYAMLSAQLTALQYQLNPHFLFNTLQSIDLEILRMGKGPSPANAMMEHLSELLRYSLDNPMQEVDIQKEIEMTRHYIAIQKAKKGDLFAVTWEYEEEVFRYKTLRLIIQPIVENCLSHAMNDNSKLWIKIKIFQRRSSLYIRVIDNGRGMSKEKLLKLREKLAQYVVIYNDETKPSLDIGGEGKHIGLRNIVKRLTLSNDQGYLTVQSKQGVCTAITIRTELK